MTGVDSPIDLGTLGGASSTASAVSADGNVIVGHAQTSSGAVHAVKWVDGSTTPIDLSIDRATPEGNVSAAYAVSADGTIIAGTSEIPGVDVERLVFWDRNSVPIVIGNLVGKDFLPVLVSADGAAIVWTSGVAKSEDFHSFIYKIDPTATILDNVFRAMPQP